MPSEAKREEWANQIFPHIPSGPGPLRISLYDLAGEALLSTVQVRHGIAWLREQMPDLPLVTWPGGGYSFTLEREPRVAFGKAQLQESIAKIRHWYRGVQRPYLNQAADPYTIRTIDKSAGRLLEDLEEMLKMATNGK